MELIFHAKIPAFHKKSPLSINDFAISKSGFSVKVLTLKTSLATSNPSY